MDCSIIIWPYIRSDAEQTCLHLCRFHVERESNLHLRKDSVEISSECTMLEGPTEVWRMALVARVRNHGCCWPGYGHLLQLFSPLAEPTLPSRRYEADTGGPAPISQQHAARVLAASRFWSHNRFESMLYQIDAVQTRLPSGIDSAADSR